MARAVFEDFLRRLRRCLKPKEVPTPSDGQLLQRFLRGRDDEAFTTLVERHAAMALSVARRVLHDAHEAEDVFQATFFVLARKADSIGRRRALAGWLYQVAYHLALKANSANARRRSSERTVATMPQAAPEANLDRDELRAILDQELSHLPEKYRAPLVLHYLEGNSKDQTASLLGWTEGTVSGRLARARDLLRGRLVRRGFTLSAASVATVLAENTVTAAVSPILLNATIDAALVFAQGVTAVGAGSASAAVLATGMVKSMMLAKMKMVVAAVLVGGVLAASAGTVAYRATAGAVNAPTPNPARIQKPIASQREVARHEVDDPTPKDEGNDAPFRVSASGKIVDENGGPIAGATVYLREIALLREEAAMRQPGYTDILAQTTTNADGQFAFKEVAAKPMQISPSNIYHYPWNLVVTAPGRGMAWHLFKSRNDTDLSIVMSPEARLRGRLLDSRGKSAAGTRVQFMMIDDQLDPDPRKRMASAELLYLQFSSLPLAVLTDADGQFILSGLPKNKHIGLHASDARFAHKYLSYATVDNAEIERLNAPPSVPAESKLLPDGFTATLQPSGLIRGKVTYRDTGRPVIGGRMGIGVFRTLTDNLGRYSFHGFDSRKHHLWVQPPDGTDYLGGKADLTIPEDTHLREQDFLLERGSVITGKLRDKDTGQPLHAPYLHINYQSEEDPSNNASTRSKTDGSFRLVVPPGKGKLYTYDSVPGSVPREHRETSQPITIKLGETLTGKDLLFLRGVVARGRILDPEGKPVIDAHFHGATDQPPSGANGTFTMHGLSQDQKSNFLVLHAQRKLGAKITIEPQKDTNPMAIDVKLRPTQALNARVVDEKKQPVANARVSLRANIKTGERGDLTSFTSRPVGGLTQTDAAGKYVITTLVAGGSYTVQASAAGYAAAQAHFRVEDGKDPEVADLVLLANRLTLGGIVVNRAGKPIEGVQVTIMPRNPTLADNHESLETKGDGRFHFHSLPRGEYRLLANLWKKTGDLDKDGRPANKLVARTELKVQSGQETIRITLDVP